MSKAITEKKYYRVSNTDKDYHGLLDVPFGIWITTHSFEVISSTCVCKYARVLIGKGE